MTRDISLLNRYPQCYSMLVVTSKFVLDFCSMTPILVEVCCVVRKMAEDHLYSVDCAIFMFSRRSSENSRLPMLLYTEDPPDIREPPEM